MKKIFCALLAMLLLSTMGHAQVVATANKGNTTTKKGSFDLAGARRAIEANNLQFGAAMASGDSAALVDMYHSQAIVYPPNMPAGGAPVMGSMARMLPGMGIKKVTLTTNELEGDAGMLVESGSFEMSDGSNVVEKGKYMVVWKMEGGKWKLYRDIWNSDQAPPTGGQ